MEFSLFLPLLPPSLFIMLGSKKISGRTVHLVLHATMESMWRLAPRLFESEKKSHTAPVKKQPSRDSPQKCDKWTPSWHTSGNPKSGGLTVGSPRSALGERKPGFRRCHEPL